MPRPWRDSGEVAHGQLHRWCGRKRLTARDSRDGISAMIGALATNDLSTLGQLKARLDKTGADHMSYVPI